MPRVPPWLAASVPVLAGVGIMATQGAAAARWAMQLGALALALVVHLALRGPRVVVPERAVPVLASAGVLLVAATLLAGGMDGVHRWLRLGPVQLHASALVVPALLVFVARSDPRPVAWQLGLVALQLAHLAQPDAGQATALLAGVIALAIVQRPRPADAAALFALLMITGATWLRPDPLAPVAFVEDMVPRAFAAGAAVGALALAALLLLAAAPFVGGRAGEPAGARRASWALGGYLAGTIAVAFAGAFPVPLLGFGASPILGVFVALAALERLRRGAAGGAGQRDAKRAPDCGKATPP